MGAYLETLQSDYGVPIVGGLLKKNRICFCLKFLMFGATLQIGGIYKNSLVLI
jgi:hypothetical protein